VGAIELTALRKADYPIITLRLFPPQHKRDLKGPIAAGAVDQARDLDPGKRC